MALIKKGIMFSAAILLVALGGAAVLAEDKNFTFVSPQKEIYWTPPDNFSSVREQWAPPAGQTKITQPWFPPPGFKAPTEVWAPPAGWGEVPEWKSEPDFRGKIIRE